MRIHELVNEAISISHLEEPIKLAINDGVKAAVGSLYELKNQYAKQEDKFDEGYTTELLNILSYSLMNHDSPCYMGQYIAKSVKKLLDSELGKIINKIEFIDLLVNVNGQADGNDIDMNEKALKPIVKKVVENLLRVVNDNYGEGEMTGGLWFIVNSFKRGERDYERYVIDGFERDATNMASTIVHEVVHVIQHDTQDKKGFPNHEYRSYLDKKKGEFVDLHNKRYASSSEMSPDEESRYFKLYMASPQEMASFSHELAISMINDYNLPDARSSQELDHMTKAIDAEGIIDYVNTKVGRYFRKPENKREYAVFKRYVKLVYQELQAYITKRKKQLFRSLDEGSKYLGPTTKVKINKKGIQTPLNKKAFGV